MKHNATVIQTLLNELESAEKREKALMQELQRREAAYLKKLEVIESAHMSALKQQEAEFTQTLQSLLENDGLTILTAQLNSLKISLEELRESLHD